MRFPWLLIAGRYQILEPVVESRRSKICRALDLRDQSQVAIKQRPPHLAEYHERELKALQRIQHPHVVRFLDAGQDDAKPWIAMEWIAGETLGARVNHGPLNEPDLVLLMQQMLSALSAIHAAGYLHRDLNPENILLSGDDERRVTLVDFELAQPVGAHLPDSATGAVHCMAPEQFSDSPLGVGTDLYALGVVAWFGLTGGFPFEGDSNAQVITGHLHGQLPSLKASASPEIAAWIENLLRRNPKERPPDADAALATLNWRRQKRPPAG